MISHNPGTADALRSQPRLVCCCTVVYSYVPCSLSWRWHDYPWQAAAARHCRARCWGADVLQRGRAWRHNHTLPAIVSDKDMEAQQTPRAFRDPSSTPS
ncbi:hypothetical protein ElyMa_006801500 [Elysia marginata]|uniref:FLYWCH-type domain-containing protein n=1 Tax=Elysia marginata TaxID=1093978 RepID=A0AAV4J6N6_9GAST|nr:hypothetical protein ElyMa_006801500 [Elysia marginata]